MQKTTNIDFKNTRSIHAFTFFVLPHATHALSHFFSYDFKYTLHTRSLHDCVLLLC